QSIVFPADDKTPMQGKNEFMQLLRHQPLQRRGAIPLALLFLSFPWLIAPAAAQEIPKEPLDDITQLTSGFSRAGEGYFSPDMKWIIFQAVPPAQEQYQMYVARLHLVEGKSPAIDTPIRISPEKSRNTCGYFSPDGKSLIFASTAGKEKPDEPSGGYQRQGRSYVWSFPSGMEIFRFDDWQEALANARPAGIVDLAKHPLTNNEVYDAEGSFSPDGKYICYTHGGGKDADIYIMKSDGLGPIRITTAPGYDGGPFFSPEGKRLVYRSDRKSNDKPIASP